MSQFDQTTEIAASKIAGQVELRHRTIRDFTAGRNSAKESLEILARALEFYANVLCRGDNPSDRCASDAIAAVKARGDWPLEEA